MKFGKVNNPDLVDFTLPAVKYQAINTSSDADLHIGFPRWGKKDLPGLFPKGIKDELAYYSRQLNSVELNATFYNNFSPDQISRWRDRTKDNFMFFPKVHQYISHIKRLKNVDTAVMKFAESVKHFENKLGISFMQMHDNYDPSNLGQLISFVERWPVEIPLAIELRHTAWYNDQRINDELRQLFKEYNITSVITDTAGRRDLVHMQFNTANAFIRFVGCDHPVDYKRLDDWVNILTDLNQKGLQSFNFFIHQNQDVEAPQLSRYFIKKINRSGCFKHPEPRMAGNTGQTSLF